MFTGLIELTGKVVSTSPFEISFPPNALKISEGDSISVNGVCLTALAPSSHGCRFDLSNETLRLTTLSELRKGDDVNLEPALLSSSRLGGHLVQGHIDSTGSVISFEPVGESHELKIRFPSTIRDFLVPKGSIAVDGVSLTINRIVEEALTIMIVPHTYAKTTLKYLVPGRKVNLEVDILGKYVVQYLKNLDPHKKEPHENISHP